MAFSHTAETALRRAWQAERGNLGLRELLVALMFLLPLGVFLAGFRYQGSSPGDTYPNELLPISILTDHDLALTEFATSRTRMPHYFVKVNGRIVSAYPIVPGLLQLPVYGVAALMGVNLGLQMRLLSLITSSLISALSVLFLYLALRRLLARELAALSFALLYAFGTAVWSVTSRGIWQHGPSLLFIAIALYLIFTRSPRLVALSGFFLGMAIWNRPTNLVLVLPLGIYAALLLPRPRARHAALLLGLAAVPLALMSLYSITYLGSIAALGQGQGLAGFTGQMHAGLLGLLFSPSRGLFVFSPIFVPAALYMLYLLFARRTPLLYRLLGGSVVALILVYSKWRMWWGGYCFGYRLIIEVVPFLMIFLALAWQEVIRRHLWTKAVFFVFVLISLYVNLLGAFVYPTGFDKNIDTQTQRLWVVRHSELVQCTAKLFTRKPPPQYPEG